MTAIVIPTIVSGDSFGPLRESLNLINPIAELGPVASLLE